MSINSTTGALYEEATLDTKAPRKDKQKDLKGC
jgi:hypothetical protein